MGFNIADEIAGWFTLNLALAAEQALAKTKADSVSAANRTGWGDTTTPVVSGDAEDGDDAGWGGDGEGDGDAGGGWGAASDGEGGWGGWGGDEDEGVDDGGGWGSAAGEPENATGWEGAGWFGDGTKQEPDEWASPSPPAKRLRVSGELATPVQTRELAQPVAPPSSGACLDSPHAKMRVKKFGEVVAGFMATMERNCGAEAFKWPHKIQMWLFGTAFLERVPRLRVLGFIFGNGGAQAVIALKHFLHHRGLVRCADSWRHIRSIEVDLVQNEQFRKKSYFYDICFEGTYDFEQSAQLP